MAHVFWRRIATAVCAVGLAPICGCSHPATAPTPAISSTPPPITSPPVARPVTNDDLNSARQAVRAAPRSTAAYLRLGNTCLALGQFAAGANALRRAAELDPQSEVPLLALARLYKDAGGYVDRECNILRRLIAHHTRNPFVYLRLGQIYLGFNWLEQARPLLETSLKLDPSSTPGQIEMAHYLFSRGNPTLAIAKLQAIHLKKANDPVTANLLGQYHLALHNYSSAERVLRETLRFLPSNRDLQVELAFVLMQQNRPDVLPEATSLLQKVASSGERQVEAYTWLGRIYENQNRTEEAIASYETAVRLQPSFENVSLALGRLYLRAGKKQDGERLVHFYEEIKQNSADYTLAREQLAQHYNDANAHAKVAGWYMRLKEYPNAIMEWKTVLDLHPRDSSARKQLVTALAATGRTTEAKDLQILAMSSSTRAGGAH